MLTSGVRLGRKSQTRKLIVKNQSCNEDTKIQLSVSTVERCVAKKLWCAAVSTGYTITGRIEVVLCPSDFKIRHRPPMGSKRTYCRPVGASQDLVGKPFNKNPFCRRTEEAQT